MPDRSSQSRMRVDLEVIIDVCTAGRSDARRERNARAIPGCGRRRHTANHWAAQDRRCGALRPSPNRVKYCLPRRDGDDVTNLRRRLKTLEGLMTDSTGLVPNSAEWFEYWRPMFHLQPIGQLENPILFPVDSSSTGFGQVVRTMRSLERSAQETRRAVARFERSSALARMAGLLATLGHSAE
jgi:hypothetical protein